MWGFSRSALSSASAFSSTAGRHITMLHSTVHRPRRDSQIGMTVQIAVATCARARVSHAASHHGRVSCCTSAVFILARQRNGSAVARAVPSQS